MNKFEFVVVSGARAKQLLKGCIAAATGTEKLVRLAMKEVREEKVEKILPLPEADAGAPERSIMLIGLGVTGGIGAYKAVEVARGLQKRGHDVVAIMTRSARRFVGELTFEAITRRPVITDQFARGANADIEHIALATDIGAAARRTSDGQHHRQVCQRHRRRFPDVALPRDSRPRADGARHEHATCSSIPPCSAICRRSPHGACSFVDPGEGFLACGWIGKGRLAEPEVIVDAAERAETDRFAPRPQVRCLGRPDLRGSRSRALHRQPVERPHGLRDRGRSGAPRRACRARLRTDLDRSRRPACGSSVFGVPPRCSGP